jgi:hypothetical protein
VFKAILLSTMILSTVTAGPDSARVVYYRADTLTPMNITPTFDNGYLAVYDRDDVAVYAPDGMLVYRIKIPYASRIPNVAVDTDGTAGAAVNSSIAGGSAILVFDRQGSQTQRINTGGLLPSFICFAADHSIWVTGRQAQRRAADTAQFFILHHYSRNGRELGAFLPRSTFPGDEEPATDIVGISGLRCNGDRIGATLSMNGYRTKALWVETDLNGNEVGRWSVDIDGLPVAMARDGAV